MYAGNGGAVCCFTGPRPNNYPWGSSSVQEAIVAAWLEEEILAAIGRGYRHFISGMAAGVDLLAADIVVRLRRRLPITLEGAVPFPDQPVRWRARTRAAYARLLASCDHVRIFSDRYSAEAYAARDRYMVDRSSLVIAVEGRTEGGTARTLRYANACRKSVALLSFREPGEGEFPDGSLQI